jgi:uncharacterized ParB-like nuclease family protein
MEAKDTGLRRPLSFCRRRMLSALACWMTGVPVLLLFVDGRPFLFGISGCRRVPFTFWVCWTRASRS